jgi:hypothetical protein
MGKFPKLVLGRMRWVRKVLYTQLRHMSELGTFSEAQRIVTSDEETNQFSNSRTSIS